jgi:hypothetical protein
MSDGMSDMREEERDAVIRKSFYGEQILNSPSLKAGVYAQMDARDNALKKQIGGSHYADMAIQPVKFITANDIGFLEGNIIKYVCRHHAKNGAQDIKKAIHYCELLLQTKYGETK